MSKGLIKYDLPNDQQDYNLALESFASYMPAEKEKEVMSRVYPFSNENLNDLFKNLDIFNKRIAVVGSSGDQVLYGIAHGAKDITLIDGNSMALPHTELKLAAIKNLSFEQFKDFFSVQHIFDINYYKKISQDLSPQSRQFWDNIYLYMGDNPINLREYFCQNGIYDSFFRHVQAIYNDQATFNVVKNNLKGCNIEFVLSRFQDFPDNLKGKYDLIMLSNIADYVEQQDFFSSCERLSERLSDDGKMQIYYDFELGIYKGYKFIKRLAKHFGNKKLLAENKKNRRNLTLDYFTKGIQCMDLEYPSLLAQIVLYRRPMSIFVDKTFFEMNKLQDASVFSILKKRANKRKMQEELISENEEKYQ